eukprot:CFRG5003T1
MERTNSVLDVSSRVRDGSCLKRGHSGGPLILPGTDNAIYSSEVVGLVSMSSEVASRPNIAVRVSSYINWSKATMEGPLHDDDEGVEIEMGGM